VLERWWRGRGAGGGFAAVVALEYRIIIVVVGRGSHCEVSELDIQNILTANPSVENPSVVNPSVVNPSVENWSADKWSVECSA